MFAIGHRYVRYIEVRKIDIETWHYFQKCFHIFSMETFLFGYSNWSFFFSLKKLGGSSRPMVVFSNPLKITEIWLIKHFEKIRDVDSETLKLCVGMLSKT